VHSSWVASFRPRVAPLNLVWYNDEARGPNMRQSAVQASDYQSPGRRARGDVDKSAAEARVVDLVSKLSAACQGRLDRYEALEPALFADALDAVTPLEASAKRGQKGGFQAVSLQQAMNGRWSLILTNCAVVQKNKGGLTGLPLPGAHCTSVEVNLLANGRATTVEHLRCGFLRTSNSLVGKWAMTGKGDRFLEVTYAELIILGGPNLRADSRAVLETTYISDCLRIGRSKTGDIYIFRREQNQPGDVTNP
jgi:hypothetical protein